MILKILKSNIKCSEASTEKKASECLLSKPEVVVWRESVCFARSDFRWKMHYRRIFLRLVDGSCAHTDQNFRTQVLGFLPVWSQHQLILWLCPTAGGSGTLVSQLASPSVVLLQLCGDVWLVMTTGMISIFWKQRGLRNGKLETGVSDWEAVGNRSLNHFCHCRKLPSSVSSWQYPMLQRKQTKTCWTEGSGEQHRNCTSPGKSFLHWASASLHPAPAQLSYGPTRNSCLWCLGKWVLLLPQTSLPLVVPSLSPHLSRSRVGEVHSILAKGQPAEPSACSSCFMWPKRLNSDQGLLMGYTEKEKVPNVGSSYFSQKLWLFSWFNFVAENITSSNKFVCHFGNTASENLFPFVTRCKKMGKGYSLKTKFFTRELRILLRISHGRRMLVVIHCGCS